MHRASIFLHRFAKAWLCAGLSVGRTVSACKQLTILRKMGCDEGQGFFLARPCRARDIPSLLELVPG